MGRGLTRRRSVRGSSHNGRSLVQRGVVIWEGDSPLFISKCMLDHIFS